MEYVKKKSAVKHVNSKNCIVFEYPMQNNAMNLAVAEITQRYPDQGHVLNHTCHEMGYVIKGSGKLVTESEAVTFSVGDAIYIPPGEKYYWEGSLTILLFSNPPWYPEQHETIPE